MKEVTSGRYCTVTLAGTETVKYPSKYDYVAVQNIGTSAIYVSSTDNTCTAGADGVIMIPAGASAVIRWESGTLYLNGSGSCQIAAQYDANNPFKMAVKGGDNLIPYQQLCKHLYLCDNNPLSTEGWKDLIGTADMVGETTINADNSISFAAETIIPTTDDFLKKTFTEYVVCKLYDDAVYANWYGLLNTTNSSPTVDLCGYHNCAAIGTAKVGYDITTSKSIQSYAVWAVRLNDTLYLYQNGEQIGYSTYMYSNQSTNRRVSVAGKYKAIALYEGCHSAAMIAEISQKLARYVILT